MGIVIDIPIKGIYLLIMRIIATRTINAYRICYPEADEPLRAWAALIKGNDFEHFPAIKEMFPHADYVEPDRVIFNIKGNHFRLIAAIEFKRQIVFVKWFGWHKDYVKLKPLEVQHEYPPC